MVQPCDFSLTHYLETLNGYINAGYVILPEANVARHIHLRHDVDLSLDYAYDLALIEYKNDILATYYIMLHTPLYNAFSPEGMKKIGQIADMGHKIGLHIDTRSYLPNDFDTLSLIAGTNQMITDWRRHLVNLTPEWSEPEPRPADYKYISDSGRHWREGCFCQHIGKYNKMEILMHPEWWTVSPGEYSKYAIMDHVSAQAKGKIAQSFRNFKNLVEEYDNEIRLQQQTPAVHS